MEPHVESIVLHPAILIASGFDCITSSQVRFLNAHRRHFHNKLYDLNETLSMTSKDLHLGGILNPHGHFFDMDMVYRKMGGEIPNFPYLTRRELLAHIYQDDLTTIWSEMMIELFGDLSQFCVSHKRSRTYYEANTKVIHELYPYPIYQKITALHLCGLGGKLVDTFGYVFSQFKTYESKRFLATALG